MKRVIRVERLVVSLAVMAGLGLGFLPGAQAAETRPRYELRQTGSDQFIRLDTVTGNVSACSRATGQWICKSAADDRKAYRDEISRLEQKNRQLELKIATIEKKLESKQDGLVLRLPDEATVDRMMGYLRSMMEKFIDMAREFDAPPDRV
jgi:hypothetical protein